MKIELVRFVKKQVLLGRPLGSVLKNLDLAKSTYFSWKARFCADAVKLTKLSRVRITPAEVQMILEAKRLHPLKRHRQIQGFIQNAGAHVSSSTVYKVLKAHDQVEPYERRESPWQKPRYCVPKRNLVWGADWTKLQIGYENWHLLTLIDFFSRLFVAWDIVPQVNSSHIKALYERGLSHQGLQSSGVKPRLRVDQGAPNTARTTRQFFLGIAEDLLSFARVRRPTDNAITERFYGTIKQEEIYVIGNYIDLQSAKQEISGYMRYYNEDRPHQSLWNFTPHHIHEVNNNSAVKAELEEMKFVARRRRQEYWIFQGDLSFKQRIAAMAGSSPQQS